jgi:hypothetical protein
MTFIQRFFTSVLPAAWARDLESESRSWLARCPCGEVRSIWDLGGIRWKARGNPMRLMRCPRCGEFRTHRISRAAGV